MGDNKKLYDVLVKVPSLKGAGTLKDFNTFNSAYSSDESQKKLFDVLSKVPELKGASTLSDFNNFKSSYFLQPKEEPGILEKIGSIASTIPFLVTKLAEKQITKQDKNQAIEELQKAGSQRAAVSVQSNNPIVQNKIDNDAKIQPFKDFRKFVPDPAGFSDSIYVGQDMANFYTYDETIIKIEDKEPIKTYITKVSPSLNAYELKEKTRQFKIQADQQIQRLKDEKEAKVQALYKEEANIRLKAMRENKSPFEIEAVKDRDARTKKIQDIEKEYDRRINEVSKAYQELKQNTFEGLYQYVQKKEEIENRNLDAETLPELKEKLQQTKTYIDSLNNQPQSQRIRKAGKYTVGKENIGESDEVTSKKIDQYLISGFIGKQTKQYQGTVEDLQLNNSFTDSYIKQKEDFQKNLDKRKQNFQTLLNEQVFSKGLTLDDLTPESKQRVEKERASIAEEESLLPMYDDLIASSKKRSDVLLSDIASYKDLINHKAEQDKINNLYKESPISTMIINFPEEFGKKILYGGASATSLGYLYVQKKLGNISKEDADLYLHKVKELSERPIYIQKLVVDENTGQLVYKNLKEVESVSIFNKKGELDVSLKNVDALVYNIFNTTAESLVIGFTGSLFRKGAFYLGEKALGKQLGNLAMAEAISASALGLSGASKAGYLAAKGLQKTGVWAVNVTSMVPATTLLYSPEIINREIEKGLSVEDVAITAGLRLLAENVAENLFFDDVKFVDNLLKTGEIRNFTELSKSEAYKLLMDKVSIASVGRKMSDMEFKALFTGKGLRNLLSKENYEYLLKISIPEKAKWLRDASLFTFDAQIKESGEEVSTNGFNVLVDKWRKSKDESYESDQPFTFENQANTVVQTMASMLLLGGMQGVRMASKGASDRRYNIDLAAYHVAMSPQVFKENLYDQFLKSQNTQNPMGKDELALRMNEIDRIATVYNSLGFTEEKTKENIQNQIEKIKSKLDAKSKKEQEEDTGDQEEDVLNSFLDNESDDVIDKEILKQAQIEVRNTEFQAFRDALTKSKLENDFINAKTDEQKEKILEKLNETIDNIETLKEQRKEQMRFFEIEKAKTKLNEYDEVTKNLSNAVDNIDTYIDNLENLNEVEEQIQVLETYKEATDQRIKAYANTLLTALKNKQAVLIFQGAKRLTDEELEQKAIQEANTFTRNEKQIIDSLKIAETDISKVDGIIKYNYENEEFEFDGFVDFLQFLKQKESEKENEIINKRQEEIDRLRLEDIQTNILDVEAEQNNRKPASVYKNKETGNFGIIYPTEGGQEVSEFSTLDELENFIYNELENKGKISDIEEEIQQTNLESYNAELDILLDRYNKTLKNKVTKDEYLSTKNKKEKEKIDRLKKKYNIRDERTEQEKEERKTINPLVTEFSEDDITNINLNNNQNELQKQISKLTRVQGQTITISYEGFKLLSAYSSIAYQARKYSEDKEIVEEDDNISITESINDDSEELNKEFLFLHSAKFLPGQKFTVVVKDVIDSNFIEEEKKKLTENMQPLINQGIKEFEILTDLGNDDMFREIQIFTEDGKYVGTVHSLSYVRPSRVVETLYDSNDNKINNLADNYKILKNLRSEIIKGSETGKIVSLNFTNKGVGFLALNSEMKNRKLAEAFKNAEALKKITVLKKQSTLRVGTQETINEGMQGGTVLPIITPDGKYFALNLSKAKLQNAQINSFVAAVKLHLQYENLERKALTEEEEIKAFEKINEIIEKIRTETGHDISTIPGLKDYLGLFVNVNSKTSDYYSNSESAKELQDIPFLDIDTDKNGKLRITFSNARTFIPEEEDIEIGEGSLDEVDSFSKIGIYRLKNITLESFDNEVPLLKDHLRQRTINHNVDLAQKNNRFNLPHLEETGVKNNPYTFVSETKLNESGIKSTYKSYKDFLVDTSLTPVIETEFEGNYIYFQQPRLDFTVSITNPPPLQITPEEEEEEKTPTEEEAPVTTDTEAEIEVVSENYTKELLRANPNKLFLFGDNNARTGKGGQAVIRNEPNAMGISTKLLPKNTPEAFMSDDQLVENKAVIDSDIKKAKERATKEGKTIVLPKGGFGTGLAALATKAPETFAYLNKRLQEEFGFDNTTGELEALEGKKEEGEKASTPLIGKQLTLFEQEVKKETEQDIVQNMEVGNQTGLPVSKILVQETLGDSNNFETFIETEEERKQILKAYSQQYNLSEEESLRQIEEVYNQKYIELSDNPDALDEFTSILRQCIKQ